MTVPIIRQRLDPVAGIKTELERDRPVDRSALLAAVEYRLGTLLSADLRELFSASPSPTKQSRGRPPKDRGVEDFSLEDLNERYCLLLQQFQSEPVDKSRPDHVPPSERAYRQLLEEFKDIFAGIDWLALRNKRSAWKSGRFYSSEELVDSEDFEAEIERQFPAHK